MFFWSGKSWSWADTSHSWGGWKKSGWFRKRWTKCSRKANVSSFLILKKNQILVLISLLHSSFLQTSGFLFHVVLEPYQVHPLYYLAQLQVVHLKDHSLDSFDYFLSAFLLCLARIHNQEDARRLIFQSGFEHRVKTEISFVLPIDELNNAFDLFWKTCTIFFINEVGRRIIFQPVQILTSYHKNISLFVCLLSKSDWQT